MNRTIDASETLRRLLEDVGLTQEEFARANDMGIATANRWVNGKVNVSERKLARAIAAVGADPSKYGVALPTPAIPADTGQLPQWFAEHQALAARRHAEVMQKLGDILAAVESSME